MEEGRLLKIMIGYNPVGKEMLVVAGKGRTWNRNRHEGVAVPDDDGDEILYSKLVRVFTQACF